MHDDRLGDGVADANARIEARERVLKHHLDMLAHVAQRLPVGGANVAPLEADFAAAGLDETQDRTPGRRLAAAALAHQRQGLASGQRERNALDRMHMALQPRAEFSEGL